MCLASGCVVGVCVVSVAVYLHISVCVSLPQHSVDAADLSIVSTVPTVAWKDLVCARTCPAAGGSGLHLATHTQLAHEALPA